MKKVMLFLLLLCINCYAMAQQATISGVVTTQEDGTPIVGASVSVKGTATGTVSDVDGNFSIKISSEKAVLVFTYLGYEKKEVSVTSTTKNLRVTLKEDSKLLEEVVVVAYGKAKKPTLTTAQIGVSAKQVEETVNTTVEQALQGRAAGVYITQNSGQPGGAISVNIRGVNSLTGTNEPLYVIDGVQIQGSSSTSDGGGNPLAGLNPSDIADMQILQGPSASALYGSKATNGVILITTKRGKTGDIRINYGYQLTEQMTPKHLPMMDLQQYAEFANFYAGTNNVPSAFLDPTLLGKGTDWQKELFRTAAMYKHSLSVSGGGDKLTYYLSGEYLNQEGVAQGSGFSRYGFRLNMDNKAYDWLTIGLNLNYNQTSEILSATSDVISDALRLTPQTPVKNYDGSWGGSDELNGAGQWAPVNPIALANLTTNNNVQRQFVGGGNIQLTLLPGLIFRTTLNANLGYKNSNYFKPTYAIDQWHRNDVNEFRDGVNFNTYWNLNELVQYTKQFDKHYLEVMASHEAQESTWKNLQGIRTDFPTNTIFDLNMGDKMTSDASGGHGDWAMESWMGRINYNYAERYMVSATIRTDGSSNFGQNNRWGTFPSLSAAWRIAQEPWYNLGFMNEAKLRFETGTTGNQGGGGIYAVMTAGPTPWGTAFSLSQYPNPDLKWESTVTYNAGINLGFLDNRIQFEGDYYVKNTDNLLMQAPLPDYMGAANRAGLMGSISAPQVNFGSIRNTGLAFSINSTNINTEKFTWSSSFNISGDRPVVTKLNTNSAQAVRKAPFNSNLMQVCEVEKTPWLFYGYIFDGYFASLDDINNSAVSSDNTGNRYPADEDARNGIWVGDIKYRDISGPDGKSDGIIDTYDQTTIGNPWPKFYGGLTNTFSYKGFDLSILLTFTYGNDIFNYQKFVAANPHNYWVSQNNLAAVNDYAQIATDANGNPYLENPNAFIPRLTGSEGNDVNQNWNRITNRWIEDGSFIRVKNISLTYALPKTLLNKTNFIRDLRLTFSAQNLFTFTKYTGFDPEVGAYVGSGVYGVNQQVIGTDYGKYPLTPIYTFSVNVNL